MLCWIIQRKRLLTQVKAPRGLILVFIRQQHQWCSLDERRGEIIGSWSQLWCRHRGKSIFLHILAFDFALSVSMWEEWSWEKVFSLCWISWFDLCLVVGRQIWKIQQSVVGWAKVGSPGSLWTNWDLLQLWLWWCSIYEQALVHCVSKVGVKKGWAVWRQRSDVKVLWVQPYRTPVAGNTQAYRGDFQSHLGFLTSRKT